MKFSALASVILALFIAVGSLCAQPYGLDQPQPVGAYLNNVFPHTAPSSSASWHVEVAFTNITFDQPIFMLPYPGTNRLVMVHKQGRITTFPNRRNALPAEEVPFLDISSRTFTVSDSGMTGCVFHPEFGQPGSTNRGYFYVTYKCRPTSVGTAFPDYAYIRLSRFTVPDGQTVADPNSEVILMQQFDRQEFHDAGCLLFGADGYLYFSIGDEGGANDEYNVTQIVNERLMSGVFRIDVNQNPTTSHAIRRQPFHHPATPAGWPESYTTNYLVPNDNPFVNPNGSVLEEFYALGFRQPYRFSRDPVTGLIWLADSGQSTREEIDILVPGANYQWAWREGTVAGPKAPPAVTNGFEKLPLWDYGRDQGGCAIGGYVYRGVEHAGFLTGKYIWADNVSGRIWAINSDGMTLTNVEYLANMPSGSVYGGTSSCALDGQGEIYFLKFGGDGAGQVFKLARTTTVVPDPPALLSQVGAFTNLATLAPAPGLIPYDVNAPLWSDGAAKQRWMAVPSDGTNDSAAEKITFSATSEWLFPAGTVFVKQFDLPVNENNPAIVKRLETRFLVRAQNGGVYGVTYKWRPDGSDADLLLTGDSADYNITTTSNTVRTQHWSFPSRLDCLTCHNANAHGVLGLKTHQLNGDVTYPQTGRTDNQLRTLGHLGMFTSEFHEAQIGNYLKSCNPTNTSQPLVTRVRSYIDANCAHCHRPGGQRANFDARYVTPLEQQNLIYGAVLDAVNGPEDRVVRPQDVLHSMMHNRASRVGALQMPPLAKNVVDTKAVQLFADWINSLPTGPGVALTLTNGAPIYGPFTVNVQFTEPVSGVLSGQFIVDNGQITSLTGSGQAYTIVINPQVKGAVNLQYAAGQVTGATGQGNYASNPLAVNYDPLNLFLSTWLPFDEGTGTTTADASGHDNSGTLLNMLPAAWSSGIMGNALTFDGVNNYVQINNQLGASFTISCWIKTGQTFQQTDPTYNGTGIIWSDVGGPANDFVLGGTRSVGGVNRLSFFAGSGNATISGTQEISTGQWTHLAVTRDGTSGAVKLYVNGVLDASGTTGTAVLNANPIINIGGNTLDGRYFNGALDDVRFYSRVLTPGEIATLLPSTPPTVTLATAAVTVTNLFQVTASFSESVSGFGLGDVVVLNGHASQLTGNGGVYGFTITPDASGSVTVRIPASRVTDADGYGNIASTDLVVTVLDAAVPVMGLADYWAFNETNGATAFDSSASGNNGLLQNLGNSSRVSGVWGNALSFNGTNSYVAVSNNLGGDFTISLWMKSTQLFPQTDNTYAGTGIFWSDVGGTHNDFILGGTRSTAGTNRLSFFTGNPDSSLNGTKDVSNGKWTHVAVVRIKSTGERRLFVNGLLDGANFGGTNLLTSNSSVSIGGNTGDGRYFLGQLDEMRVYNRALADAEVASLAASGGYASWVAAAMPGVSAGLSSSTADPDGDGQPNLIEYAFDTNPLQSDASPFKITSALNGSLRLTFPRRTGFSGLIYTVLKSDDLVSWLPVAEGIFSETTQPVAGKNVEIVTDQLVNVSGRAFFRIQVTATAP
ncbi:MAG TPA: LamG-like jellyroll fold domain-containing protein [Verrucomicrobiae bacterium]|nr:LamG-like jellyroll fold domain-containing protein [Verrucomicrobiae bacterium]